MVFDLIGYFQNIVNSIPENQKLFVSLVVYTFLIFMYSLFIWKFYRFLASRELIQLNLKQYNYSSHPLLEKFFAVLLYTLEYLVILPFLVVFWFAILSIFLLVLSESQNTLQILLISAAIIASTRITSYISEDLSKDIAKILPFTVLAAFILGADFINVDKILGKISAIPSLFNDILIFLVFIFVIEFVFRSIYSTVEFFRSGEEES
ncbi:hypothetical protein CMI42_01210 [Candidatus Pacearchaeota archaeon]|nr:hypothetical protein [Candidatus Pacearchaeota archaeon]